MRVYVPFDPRDPKTRLSSVLDDDERVELSFAMLEDVYEAVEATGHSPFVLSTRALEREPARGFEAEVCPEPLTPAVNSVLEREERPVAVVVADLPLVTPAAVELLFAPDEDFVVAPGRGGGTNAFVTRLPDFRVDYHGTSFLDHLEAARELGADVGVVDSFRLSTDADEPEDLVEVLLHGEGRAAGFVNERFELTEDEQNRVRARRR
jgi:2-phospho-L-lactate guanylyltransferase